MLKSLHTTLVILLLPAFLLAANPDSLIARLDFAENSTENKFELYKEIGLAYYQQYDYAAAKTYIEQGLALARKTDNTAQEFIFLNELGYIYFWMDEYEPALTELTNARALRKSVPQKNIAANLARISEVYVAMGDYTKALDHQFQALEISEVTEDSLGIANSLRLMGTIYWYRRELNESLRYTKEALSIFKRMKDPKSAYTCLAALSSVFTEKKELDEALRYARESLTIAKELNYPYGVAFSVGMVGSILKDMGKFEEAFTNIHESLRIFKELNVRYESIEFSVMLADLFGQKKQFDQSIDLYLQNLELAQEINSMALMRDIHESLSETYEVTGDSAKALAHFKHYTAYKDSLINETNLLQMAELEKKYEVELQEKAIIALEKKNQEFYIYSAAIGIGFLLVIVWLFYLRFKTQTRVNELLSVKNREIADRNDQLANSNAELRQFADIISKDLKEPLLKIGQKASSLEQEMLIDEGGKVSQIAATILHDVTKMDSLLADLSAYSIEGMNEEAFETFDVSAVVTQVISDMPATLQGNRVKIRVQNLPEIYANKRQITLVFRNLIENALKFRREKDPEITIHCDVKSKYFRFSVRDNGIGIPIKEQQHIFATFKRLDATALSFQGTGIGLAICRKIVEIHQGKIWVHSQPGEGSTFFFTLPR